MSDRTREKTRSDKADVLMRTNELANCVIHLVCNEKVFPKRSRWVIAGKIADTALDYFIAANTANGIKALYQDEAIERHRQWTIAIARVGTLDALMGLAQANLGIDVGKLGEFSRLCNSCRALCRSLKNSDEKRFPDLFKETNQ